MGRGRRTVSAMAVLATASTLTLLALPAQASDGASPGRSARAAAVAADHDTDWADGPGTLGRKGARAVARTTTVNPATGPDFELPFRCGQAWRGSSRAGHSPSYYSIDFNATNDLGQPVLASAPGVVTTAKTLSGSYGRYVVIDHGRGFTTLYGHLNAIVASVGQYVDQGDLIGYLGTSGNSTGPHLHFEERSNGAYFPPYFHRATFRINSVITSSSCGDRPVTGDWNGDGYSDRGIFRRAPATGQFFLRTATTNTMVLWQQGVDRPVVGDFDGDGVSQVGVRRQAGGTWVLRGASGALATVSGVVTASDQPLTGDWDGNGRDNLGFFRWSTRTFYLRADNGTYTTIRLGGFGDQPIVGDWNGDGKDDVGVHSPYFGTWTLRIPSGTSSTLTKVTYGTPSDLPVVGDWNHDGRDDIGFWRPGTAQYVLRTPAAVSGRFSDATSAMGNPR